MTCRRGLTLLEMLFAAALLSLIAATCIPLLRGAAAHGAETSPRVDPFDLARLADEVLADPAAVGLADLNDFKDVELAWPQAPERPPVHVRLLATDDPAVDHAWLVFECGWGGELVVSRWVHVEPPEDDAS